MGIQGLLPFLKDATEQTNIKKYAGYTVAVDTYCWLHKGAFACAMQLAKGEATDQYVRYVLKYVNMLLSYKVKPILVFDGCNLKSKEGVEKSRRERRELNHAKGKQFLREGKVSEARDCFTKCINVTSKMALDVMKAARSLGVDCIVAPYEADAQLAYLSRTGMAQCVITEDSDLTAFGCDKVMVKMDLNGNGLEIDKSKFNQVMKMGGRYDYDRFRYMCIMSGCDYLPSLPNIGLKKAWKVFRMATTPDLTQVLKRLGQYLKTHLVVPQEYIDGFIRANNTFLYQLAFDPVQRKVVPLNPYAENVNPQDMEYAGKRLPDKLAIQLSLGNIDVHTMQSMNDYAPNPHKPVDKNTPSHLLSIWHKDYRPLGKNYTVTNASVEKRPSTQGKEVSIKSAPWKAVNKTEKKIHIRKDKTDFEDEALNDDDLKSQYNLFIPAKKKSGSPSSDSSISPTSTTKTSVSPTPELQTAPQKTGSNPQRKKLNKFAMSRMTSERRQELLQENNTETSRFFANSSSGGDEQTSPVEQVKKSDLYSAMVECEQQKAEENVTEDTEKCEIAEEKPYKTLRDKFEYQKPQKASENVEDTTAPARNLSEGGDIAESEIRAIRFETEVMDLGNGKMSASGGEDIDSKPDGVQSTPKVGIAQRLSNFRWSRNKPTKPLSHCHQPSFQKPPWNSSQSTLKNSPMANSQFKFVRKSEPVNKASEESMDSTDGDVQIIETVDNDSADDHATNETDSSFTSSYFSSGISSRRSTSSSSLSQELNRGTPNSTVFAEEDEDFVSSQSSMNSSQSSAKGTRCSGLSISRMSASNKQQGSKNLVGVCRKLGLNKTTARKRKSSDENLMQSKQRKLTDMFTPKQMSEKIKTKGLPMSPIKDNNSHNIGPRPVRPIQL